MPPVSDGRYKMLESTLSRNRLRSRQDARRQAFKTRVDPAVPAANGNGLWMGAWLIGAGGMSDTGLWCRLNGFAQVVDRMMRKETVLEPSKWGSVKYFNGDARDCNNRRPMEWSCHFDMDGIQNRSHGQSPVPASRSGVVKNNIRTYSMSMEYCPWGDLDTLIKR